MSYKFAPLQPSDLTSLTNLLDNAFTMQSKNKERVITWKYFQKVKPITYVAITNSNTIAASYTNLPISIQYKERTIPALLCLDMATHSDHRRKGLISHLSTLVYNDVHTTPYVLSIGFSNEKGIQVDKYSKNYGYQIVGEYERYFSVRVIQRKTIYELYECDRFKKKYFTEKTNPYFHIQKSYSYVQWRYANKPEHTYRFFEIRSDSEVNGYVVLKFIDYRCYVHDIILFQKITPDIIRSVLRSIGNTILLLHKRIIICNVLGNNFWHEVFSHTSYLKERQFKPNRFLTIKIHKPISYKSQVMDKNKWILMNGDIL